MSAFNEYIINQYMDPRLIEYREVFYKEMIKTESGHINKLQIIDHHGWIVVPVATYEGNVCTYCEFINEETGEIYGMFVDKNDLIYGKI